MEKDTIYITKYSALKNGLTLRLIVRIAIPNGKRQMCGSSGFRKMGKTVRTAKPGNMSPLKMGDF